MVHLGAVPKEQLDKLSRQCKAPGRNGLLGSVVAIPRFVAVVSYQAIQVGDALLIRPVHVDAGVDQIREHGQIPITHKELEEGVTAADSHQIDVYSAIQKASHHIQRRRTVKCLQKQVYAGHPFFQPIQRGVGIDTVIVQKRTESRNVALFNATMELDMELFG